MPTFSVALSLKTVMTAAAVVVLSTSSTSASHSSSSSSSSSSLRFSKRQSDTPGLSGSGPISMYQYETMPPAPNNPSGCGYPWSSLSPMTGLTAISNLYPQTDCGACLKVTGPSGGVSYVTVVDLKGSAGLDMSLEAFQNTTGQTTGTSQATWVQVDPSNCKSKWNGQCLAAPGHEPLPPGNWCF